MAQSTFLIPITKPYPVKVSVDNAERTFGGVTLITYPGDKIDFVVISISWSKFVDYIEQNMNLSTNPFIDRVAYINKQLKNFMNDGFADAVLYLNPEYKQAIHTVIKEGINKAYELRPKLKNNNNVLISTSLGSKIVFDMIRPEFEKNQSNEYVDFIGNLKQIYMTSNQIPLLDLYSKLLNKNSFIRSQQIKSQTLQSMDSALSINSFVRTNETRKLPIIAFSDPNDALSYYVQPKLEKIDFINVTISHTKWWWFGKLANPAVAHGGMKSQEHGYKSLVHGSEYLQNKFKKY